MVEFSKSRKAFFNENFLCRKRDEKERGQKMLLILMFRVVDACEPVRFQKVLSPTAKDLPDAEEIIGKIATILLCDRGSTKPDYEAWEAADFWFEAYSGETGRFQCGWLGTRKR